MKALLTRSGDYFVPHRKRTSIAREQRADLFISIHADGFKDKRARGSSVWVLSHRGAQSEMGRWLEEKESASELLGGEDALSLANYDDDVAKVLLDLSMYNAVGSSLDIGSHVLNEIKGVVPKLHSKRVQQAGFLVLKNPDIPSILVETAFISNPQEEALLKDGKHQDKLTAAIVSGVKGYFEQRPPEGSRFAQAKRDKHIIGRGDTLAGLASRYQVSVKDLKEKNALKSDRVFVGQVLMIP
jgi:N-acetylmuramoyl-L-alanine amidase